MRARGRVRGRVRVGGKVRTRVRVRFRVRVGVRVRVRAEAFDGVELAFLHARRLATLDDRHGLTRVDLVGSDRVAV